METQALLQHFRSPPPGKLFCVHGDPGVFRLSLVAAGHVLLSGVPVTLVDGSNRFDLYGLAEFARRTAGGRCTPGELLRNIFVSRAFTCYQMEAVITERLPAFVRTKQSPVVLIFGLLDTFYDEQAPLFEVRGALERSITALQQLRAGGVSVLVASTDLRPASTARAGLFPRLTAAMDRVYRMDRGMVQRGEPHSGEHNGTDRTHIHHGSPAGNGKLGEIPAGAPERRSGCSR